MKTFFVTITPTRKDLINTITDKEQEVVGDHFDYLTKAHKNGIVSVAGPCLDGSFGILILCCESIENARIFMAEDPAVRAGIFTPEIKEVRLSVGKLAAFE